MPKLNEIGYLWRRKILSAAFEPGASYTGTEEKCGRAPVILTGRRDARLEIGKSHGADHVINVKNTDVVTAVKEIAGQQGVDYVVECAGSEVAINDVMHMTKRGGKICLTSLSYDPATIDLPHVVKNNIYG